MRVVVTYLRNRYENRAMEVFDYVKSFSPKAKLIDLSRRKVKSNFDLAISVGGDGTFFSMVTFVNSDYYLGIHPKESLGGRCSIKYTDYPKIRNFFEGKFKVKRQAVIKVKRNNKVLPLAINDVVIGASKLGRFFVYEIEHKNSKELGAGTGVIAYTKEGWGGFAKALNAKECNSECLGLAPIAPNNQSKYTFKDNINFLQTRLKILDKSKFNIRRPVGYISIDGIKYERDLFKNDVVDIEHGGYVSIITV